MNPLFDVTYGEETTFPFAVRDERFLQHMESLARKSEKTGRAILISAKLETKPRSRALESYHWLIQCPLWADHRSMLSGPAEDQPIYVQQMAGKFGQTPIAREEAAHYDLLETFPVYGIDDDGHRIKKTSRDMDWDEYYEWVKTTVTIGAANQGCFMPDPMRIEP